MSTEREVDAATQAGQGPFSPFRLGPVTLRNRIVKAATFEGMAPKGMVTPELIDYHRAVAAGGAGLSTVAYFAVSPEGRGAPAEIVLSGEGVATGLRELSDAIHAEGAAAGAQLGHAGPVSAGTGARGLSPSRVYSPMAMKYTKAATDDDIRKVIDDFVNGARVAAEAGFDVLELHFGHGYLISAFFSPQLNKRDDRWGGSVENRARLAREIAKRVRDVLPDGVALTAKLNMADGVPKGLWLVESLEIARLLEADGTLDALELTGGSSMQNAMYFFRGEPPLREMAESFPQPLKTGFKIVGKHFLPNYPFEEGFFLPYARQFRAALSMPLIYLGGVNRLETVKQVLREGFVAAAMGRALLREPDLPQRWQADELAEGLCVHCNKCMATIYGGTHCVLVAPEDRPGVRLRLGATGG